MKASKRRSILIETILLTLAIAIALTMTAQTLGDVGTIRPLTDSRLASLFGGQAIIDACCENPPLCLGTSPCSSVADFLTCYDHTENRAITPRPSC